MPMSGLLLDYGLLGRYSGPEVRTWEVSEPETFSMVGIILSQKMYPILCPPYRHIRTVAHSQPHATVSTKLSFRASGPRNPMKITLRYARNGSERRGRYNNG